MMRCRLSVVFLLLVLTGCTDTIDSVTREYRNGLNEGIDAMMMITDEKSAAVMRSRVFNHLPTRFKSIDEHLNTVKDNRATNLIFATEMLESDGFQLYFTETRINADRFWVELERIEHVAGLYVKKKREEENDFASSDDDMRKKACPMLDKFCRTTEEKVKNPKD